MLKAFVKGAKEEHMQRMMKWISNKKDDSFSNDSKSNSSISSESNSRELSRSSVDKLCKHFSIL